MAQELVLTVNHGPGASYHRDSIGKVPQINSKQAQILCPGTRNPVRSNRSSMYSPIEPDIAPTGQISPIGPIGPISSIGGPHLNRTSIGINRKLTKIPPKTIKMTTFGVLEAVEDQTIETSPST